MARGSTSVRANRPVFFFFGGGVSSESGNVDFGWVFFPGDSTELGVPRISRVLRIDPS